MIFAKINFYFQNFKVKVGFELTVLYVGLDNVAVSSSLFFTSTNGATFSDSDDDCLIEFNHFGCKLFFKKVLIKTLRKFIVN